MAQWPLPHKYPLVWFSVVCLACSMVGWAKLCRKNKAVSQAEVVKGTTIFYRASPAELAGRPVNDMQTGHCKAMPGLCPGLKIEDLKKLFESRDLD